jgi:carboxyl-terminal processing protease
MDVFWEAWDHVEERFFGAVPSASARTYGAIRGALSLLDPHTRFVEPVARSLEKGDLRGAHGGIGARLTANDAGELTLEPYADSPAEGVGIAAGDVLIAVDGRPVGDDTPSDEVAAMIRGEVGTEVEITVRKSSGVTLVVVIERETIAVPSLTWSMETERTGYVRMERFTDRTVGELVSALASLENEGAAGLILDLRGNRGGLVDAAVGVAERFLEKDDVVMRQRGKSRERTFRAEREGDLSTPLAVLVDGDTASAAEIVAGALQDHKRARLIGQRTFGKGSVQEIYDLADGSSLHVTSAIWLTPNGHPIAGEGLTPDTIVDAETEGEDASLRRAVEYLESE